MCNLFEVSLVKKSEEKTGGQWKILKNGVDFSDLVPDNLMESPMDTVRKFDSGIVEQMDIDMWIQYHDDWLHKICEGRKEMVLQHDEISKLDWCY